MLRSLFFIAIFFLLNSMPFSVNADTELLVRSSAHRPFAGVSLSMDGDFLSALVAEGEEQRVYVWSTSHPIFEEAKDAENGLVEALPYVRSEINWLTWVGNGHLLLSLKEKGLVLYNAREQRLRPLIDPLIGGGPRPDELLPVLLSAIPDDPSRILMQWEDPTVEGYPAVYEVNVDDGTSRKIIGAWRPIIRWWAAPNGRVLAGEGYRARRHQVYVSDSEGGWRKIHENDVFKDPSYIMLSVDAQQNRAVVISNEGEDKRALWYADLETGRLLEKLAANDTYDIEGAVFDGYGRKVIAATYSDLQNEQIFLDEEFKTSHDTILKQLQRRPVDDTASLWFVGGYTGHNKGLFQLRSERHPRRYFLHDTESDALTPIDGMGVEGSVYDDFHRTTAVSIPISRKAEMQGVLSVPKDQKGKLKLSGKGVLLIHGGPVRRSRQQYNALLNLLTSNGYVVLQPNFRGSSGFGEKWRKAGYREWGDDMQDDITSAAKWLIREGYVEKDQLCAIGGSYGGYASLMGVITERKLFQCAVSLNGVTSIPHLVNYLSGRRFSLLTTPRIQGGLSQRIMRGRSPLYLANRLKRPVLLLHATNDANVPFEHGQLMAAVLKQNRSDYEFIVLPGAEHQLRHPRFRKTYYENALRFLEQNIGKTPE
ncbi:prolyl oligopeptidase family serine peptidase [Kordiimonas sp. SCSIO 12610]|uniref:S9 family peptidase n=1 Tax=Kordiimonas sp. SCSIO 12610 TaxID=2829597 RepID=UPI002108720F|nr:prolyl oligopeptidase family serine peptidase [Kordiimonas sp. SCSIO 12610]UTW55978.1 S9 family peptidase [Kordiimonas sp. SCSIO 12610]